MDEPDIKTAPKSAAQTQSILVRCIVAGCKNDFRVSLKDLMDGKNERCPEHRREPKWSKKTLP